MSRVLIIIAAFFITELSQAQDWANLKRYQKENKSLSQTTAEENRVVFMGNSITEGWSNHHPEFFKDKPYINRGISWQTTPQMLIRFRADVIDLKPKLVVILAGTNDIAGNTGPMTLDEILNNIISMSELAEANNIKVVLSSVLPAEDYSWKPGLNPDKKIPALNDMIKIYCEKKGIIYLDYFSAMVNKKSGLQEDLTYDGVHPDKKGYLVMEPLVEIAISKALKN